MTTFITQFPTPAGVPMEELHQMFVAVAPQFRSIPGLLSKTFLLAEHGRGGGVYVWESRAHAAAFEPQLREMIRAKLGVDAEITYFDTPVVVDNLHGQIRTA